MRIQIKGNGSSFDDEDLNRVHRSLIGRETIDIDINGLKWKGKITHIKWNQDNDGYRYYVESITVITTDEVNKNGKRI